MNVVKQAKTTYIIASGILVALGAILLIFQPSMMLLRILMGSVFLFVGGSKLFGFFSNDLYKLAFQFDLALGILTLLVGCVFLIRGNIHLQTASSVAGIYIVVDSLFRIQTAFDAKKFGMTKWWSILATAIAVGATGVLTLLNPFEGFNSHSLVILMGVAFILNGGQNIWTAAYTVKVKAKKKHVEEQYENDL